MKPKNCLPLSSMNSAAQTRLRKNLNSIRQLSIATGFLLASFAFQMFPSNVSGQSDSRWIEISGGAFHKAVNWDNGVPDSEVNAIFDLESFFDIELETEAIVNSLQQSKGEIIWHGGNKLSLEENSNILAGILTLRGAETRLSSLGDFRMGETAQATINVESNTTFSNQTVSLGVAAGIAATANVSGTGAQWNSADELTVGNTGIGTINVSDGGRVETARLNLGQAGGSEGRINIQGENSSLSVNSSMIVGERGQGEIVISDGGQLLSASTTFVGFQSGSSAAIRVEGMGSQWLSSGSNFIGRRGEGEIHVLAGGSAETSASFNLGGKGTLTVDGAGSTLTAGALSVDELGSVSITGGATSQFNSSSIGRSQSETPDAFAEVLVSGNNTSWLNSTIRIGGSGNGRVEIEDGAFVSGGADIGGTPFLGGSTFKGTARLRSSTWDMGSSNARVGFGEGGDGELRIDRGTLTSSGGSIGSARGSVGYVQVSGTGGSWETSEQLEIGTLGTGTLHIQSGGYVRNQSASLGTTATGSGTVSLSGADALWELESNLDVGSLGSSSVSIFQGTVRVGLNGFQGQTSIGSSGSVQVQGGRFEFGATDLDSFSRIDGTNGSLAGALQLTGYTSISSLNLPAVNNLDTSEVAVVNQGVLHGDGTTTLSLQNKSNGEVRTRSGEWARFGGFGNSNAGEFNNFGGLIEFENDFTNEAGGFVGGQGQFAAGDGFINEGAMAFSEGATNILGDVLNSGSGQIVTSGLAIATFFDDVIHNGSEIRTSEGSATVFLGEVSGAGPFTGTGDVFFEGDLRPGNSPDVVHFAGDVYLSSSLNSTFELAGLGIGEFDMLDIAGDLSLDGNLNVELIEGFMLGLGDEFLIAQAAGQVQGQFIGLDEGDLIGTFGGQNLFITYSAGNGNDVGLFSAVPEPGSMLILVSASCLTLLRRRRNQLCNQR